MFINLFNFDIKPNLKYLIKIHFHWDVSLVVILLIFIYFFILLSYHKKYFIPYNQINYFWGFVFTSCKRAFRPNGRLDLVFVGLASQLVPVKGWPIRGTPSKHVIGCRNYTDGFDEIIKTTLLDMSKLQIIYL